MVATQETRPDWDRLFGIAAGQDGLFTTRQAAEAGYSPQLLSHHLRASRVVRVRRGIYRLVHFPPGEHEDLVAIWLWSARVGVFSHETALALHNLSDALPAKVHLTLPKPSKRRRLRIPRGVVLYFADLSERDRKWTGCIQVTSPERTILDCAAAHVAPELVAQAIEEGLERGLFARAAIEPAAKYLRSFEAGSE